MDDIPFQDNNNAVGLPANSKFQVGESDVDPGTSVELGELIPYVADPAGCYVYFDCAVGTVLDSGLVVHYRLPQVNNAPDTLSVASLDDPNFDQLAGFGVNLKCKDQYQDIIQRMGHARYWFRIWGQALRLAFQVPIPGIKSIGGVPTVPYDKNPQWAYNSIVPGGNYGGVILWRAQWSLWYTTLVPPTSQVIPAADPSAFVVGKVPDLPLGMDAPKSLPDDDAQPSQPATNINTTGPVQNVQTVNKVGSK